MKTDFLSKIIEQKKEDVAAARKQLPEKHLRKQALAPRERRPFIQRLAKPGPSGVNIIAEIKRASPSKGVIRKDLLFLADTDGNPSLYKERTLFVIPAVQDYLIETFS